MTAEERKQIAYEIAYDAMDLYEEGWRASDREELKERYDLTDWEADVMVEELEKLAAQAQYVQDGDGRTVDYAAAVELMDDDLREQLHMEMAPCSNQEFYMVNDLIQEGVIERLDQSCIGKSENLKEA